MNVLIAAALVSPLLSVAQVKPHDFTRRNATLERSNIDLKQSNLIDKRSGLEGKSFEMREYKNTKSASSLIEKSFYMDDKKSTLSIDKKFTGFSKTLDSKTFTPEKQKWFDSEKKQKLFDMERDMTKTYRGKIDIKKRSRFDTEYLQHIYEEMQERSMQDINKYQFRRSHPSDPGIKTTRAGGEIMPEEDSNSFLDMFSSRKKISVDAPLVSLKGEEKPKKSVELPSEPMVPEQRTSQPTIMERSAKKSQQTGKTKVQTVEYLDESQSKKYEFLRVPKGMKAKGKAVIKIETDE